MTTKKFWCHYIGSDGNTTKRRNIELTDIHELLPLVSNDDAETPLWYEYEDGYYLLYAQLSDNVAVLIPTMHTITPRMMEEYLLKTDEEIDREYDEQMAVTYSPESMRYHPMTPEKVAECKASWRERFDSRKRYRDERYADLRRYQDYPNYLLDSGSWVSAATIRAFKEVGSGYYPLLEIQRSELMAQREAEAKAEREARRQRDEEEARKKAEERAAEDRKLQRLTELGMLPDKLTAMQRGTVLAGLEERSCFKVSGGKYVSCTVYELIADHGFCRMGKTTEKYNRFGDPLSKPRNTYHVFNDADDTITWCYQINGRMGALMIEGKYNNQNK